jgi:hypothetical protein
MLETPGERVLVHGGQPEQDHEQGRKVLITAR